ncbi:MAG TPA: hypothetical protein VMS43_15320 [Allosphingosinicella sp.]|nr:hypothetical protein [Allosphingosinicella sp.]
MVTGSEVRDLARRNFEEVKTRKHVELAASKTTTEALDIEENYEKAMAAYLKTLIAGFEAASGNWDQLRADAVAAETDLKKALAGAQSLAARITAAGKLTGAVTKLVEAVKK